MVNTTDSKKVMFRLKPAMKTDFTLALVRNKVGAQHVLETFAEKFIAFDKNEITDTKVKSFIMSTISRARELQAEVKYV